MKTSTNDNIIEKEILSFIKNFKFIEEKTIERLFTNGNCYYFAIILKERFSSGLIYYFPISNHFTWKYNGKYYDICGEYGTNEKSYEWEDFKLSNPTLAKSIERDCIYFETR